MLDFFYMDIPLPDVTRTLTIDVEGRKYDCEVIITALPVFNYYALVLNYSMDNSFFEDYDLEEVYLNQFFPVEDRKSALSNLKAVRENDAWIIEKAYEAFRTGDFSFKGDMDLDLEEDDSDEDDFDLNDFL